jgi:hypothetical protein
MQHLSDNYFVEEVIVKEDDSVSNPQVSPLFFEEIEQHQLQTRNFPLIKINQTRLIVSRSHTQEYEPTVYLPTTVQIDGVSNNSTVNAFIPSNESAIHKLFCATDEYAQMYLD